MTTSYVLFSEQEVREVLNTLELNLNVEALRKLANDTRRRMAEKSLSYRAARHEAMDNFPQRSLLSQQRFAAYVSALGKLFNKRKRFKRGPGKKPKRSVPIDAHGQYELIV